MPQPNILLLPIVLEEGYPVFEEALFGIGYGLFGHDLLVKVLEHRELQFRKYAPQTVQYSGDAFEVARVISHMLQGEAGEHMSSYALEMVNQAHAVEIQQQFEGSYIPRSYFWFLSKLL